MDYLTDNDPNLICMFLGADNLKSSNILKCPDSVPLKLFVAVVHDIVELQDASDNFICNLENI